MTTDTHGFGPPVVEAVDVHHHYGEGPQRVDVLFDINMTAGHGGASGRFDALRETARTYAFMLQQWGLLND